MYVSFHQTVCSVHEIFDFLYKCFIHYHIKIHLIVKSNFLKSYKHTKKVKENHYRAVHLQASRASTVTGYLWARILKPAINRPIIIPGKWRWIWWPCDFNLWCLTCLLPLLALPHLPQRVLYCWLPRLPLGVLYCCSEYCSGIHQPTRRNYIQNLHTCRTAFLLENLWTSKSVVAVTDL